MLLICHYYGQYNMAKHTTSFANLTGFERSGAMQPRQYNTFANLTGCERSEAIQHTLPI